MFKKVYGSLCCVICVLECWLSPILHLVVRVWMARIWWNSAMTKVSGWEVTQTTFDLFRYEYKPPFIDPVYAAYLVTATELIAPIFLILGFATRFVAVPMLFMTLVIQFTYLDLKEHYYWMMLLSFLILKGGGALSLDRLIAKRWCDKSRA